MNLEQYQLIIIGEERFKKAARFHMVDEDICDFYVGGARDYMAKYDQAKNIIDVYGGSMGGNIQHSIIKNVFSENASDNKSKFQEVHAKLLKEGYENCIVKSDADISNIRKCCGMQSLYKGFKKGKDYRAFSVCPKCDCYEEF